MKSEFTNRFAQPSRTSQGLNQETNPFAKERKFWHNQVVYQIYPKSFYDTNGSGSGDLRGIIAKLDYLNQLGIQIIWLSPVYRSPLEDNGYDIADYQAIDESYGTMVDMEELIAQANRRGIRIVMDLVVNHTSSAHPWFIEARSSKQSSYRDYYIWADQPNSLTSVFGGSGWEYDAVTNQYYFHRFAKGQPDLNWENEQLVKEIFKMMNFWLDKGIGGFRMDVIDLIGKQVFEQILENGQRLHPLLQQMNRATFGNYDVLTVGETWGADPQEAIRYSRPDRQELSMVFQFEHITMDWGEYGKWTPKPMNLIELKRILSKWQTELYGKGWNSLFWNNHDLPRIVSHMGNDGQYRVLSAKMLAMVLHMMQGTPYIYQGEEIGMTNVWFERLEEYNDVEIHGSYKELVLEKKRLSPQQFMNGVYQMGRDNARTPMQWNESKQAGFTTGRPWLKVNPNYRQINVKAALADPDSIFYTYQNLIGLRQSEDYGDLIVYGRYQLLLPEHPMIFSYVRRYGKQCLYLVANFGEQPVDYPIDDQLIQNRSRIKQLLANYSDSFGQFIESLTDSAMWIDYPLKAYETFIVAFTVE